MARYPTYEWNDTIARYRDPKTGRIVSTDRVRQALDRAVRMEGMRARALMTDLREGTITLREWEIAQREVVKNTQLFSAAAGAGGWAQLSQREYGIVGQRVRQQYGFLTQFGDELKTGLARDGMAARRAESYAEAGRSTYHAVERITQAKAGNNEERSIKGDADHCDECIDEEAKGWRTIGTMVPIGQRECMNGCKCRVEYRQNDEAGAADITALAADAARVDMPLPSPIEPQPIVIAAENDVLGQQVVARQAVEPPPPTLEQETIAKYQTASGAWKPERKQLHEAIERSYFTGMAPVKAPTVRMLGGGPASGKSTLLRDVPANFIHIDPDEIKTMLPEWDEGVRANDPGISGKVHEESSYVAKKVTSDAVRKNYNVIVDGTGDNTYDNLAKKVASYRTAGNRVVAEYVTVDTDTALERVRIRGERTGRFVPDAVTQAIHRNVSIVVPQAIENGLFDEFVLWDNNGTVPVKIAQAVGKKLTIYDNAAWERFLAKAN